jgi:XisH protein
MAKDLYHYQVKQALINNGWKVTHDPYLIETEDVNFEVDLAAEQIFGAEKEGVKIVVEVKSFVAASFVYEFHRVVGQFLNYSIGLEETEPDRILYLAVPLKVYQDSFHLSFVRKAMRRIKMKLLIFENEKIVKWKKR